MDIRQLKYFVAVAREGNVTRAAKLLHMEQPPLSRQLKLLEEELGVALFDRTGKRLKLTSAGEQLKIRAERLLLHFQEMVEEVKEIGEGVRGVLAVGSVVSCISLLPGSIRQFQEAHPEVTFKIFEGDHFYLGEQLEKRAVELIVARLPFEAMEGQERYEVLRLPSDPYVAVVPRSWEIFGGSDDNGGGGRSRSKTRPIRMEELADIPLITLKTDRTTQMHEQLVRECRRHGFEPRITCECSSVAISLSLIAEGIGAAVLPRSVMSAFPADTVRIVELADADFQSDVGIVTLKDRYLSKSARAFIEGFASHHAN